MTVTYDPLLTIGEVARLFGVSTAAVRCWERDGKVPLGACSRTPSGQRRYSEDAIRVLLALRHRGAPECSGDRRG